MRPSLPACLVKLSYINPFMYPDKLRSIATKSDRTSQNQDPSSTAAQLGFLECTMDTSGTSCLHHLVLHEEANGLSQTRTGYGRHGQALTLATESHIQVPPEKLYFPLVRPISVDLLIRNQSFLGEMPPDQIGSVGEPDLGAHSPPGLPRHESTL